MSSLLEMRQEFEARRRRHVYDLLHRFSVSCSRYQDGLRAHFSLFMLRDTAEETLERPQDHIRLHELLHLQGGSKSSFLGKVFNSASRAEATGGEQIASTFAVRGLG